MLIDCPWCGRRPHVEFGYGGDATIRRPSVPEAASDKEWFDHVYLRDNPRGPHQEFWYHTFGCGQWLVVERDTLTHAITTTRLARAADA